MTSDRKSYRALCCEEPFRIFFPLGVLIGIAGDFALSVRGPLLDWASYLWMLAAAVWSWRVLPRVRIPDEEPQQSS